MTNRIENLKTISVYSDWIKKICTEKGILLDGESTPVKDDKLFRVPSNIGDLYLKKTTGFINDELDFTLKLMDSGIIDLPEWVGYDRDMKICLMRDMGGMDLSSLSSLDMETALNMFEYLARMQRKSVEFVKTKDFNGFDYTTGAMLDELNYLPETAYEMLSDTPYKIARDETEKMKRNTEYVKSMLITVNDFYLPDTIHHGDLGTYNVRIAGGKCVFYDWGCGGRAHPFFDTVRLLNSMRDKLPADNNVRNTIIDAYLDKWSEYGSRDELKNIFTLMNKLYGFYMLYYKYTRTRNLHRLYTTKFDSISADGLGLDNRYSTAATYIKRFIESNFN